MNGLLLSLRRILVILAKELTQLRRDRTTFGMVVMIPLIQLMLFGYAINTNVRDIPAALVDQSNTALSRVLAQAVEATQVVRFTAHYAGLLEAQEAIVAGRVRAVLIIPPVQTAIILVLGRLIFEVPLNGSFGALAATTLAFIGASLALGLVLSTLATNQLQAMQMTLFILLPSILLSGFMFPYEGMPVPAQYLAEALPVTHFMRTIRAVVLRGAGVNEVAYDTLWLVGFMVAGLIVASLRFKKRLD